MDIKKMKKLAKFLDKLAPRKFHMSHWISWRSKVKGKVVFDELEFVGAEVLDPIHCKSAACIAGWQVYLEYPKREDREKLTRHPETIASASLGLGLGEAMWLFGGDWSDNPEKATPKQAAKAVRYLIEMEQEG